MIKCLILLLLSTNAYSAEYFLLEEVSTTYIKYDCSNCSKRNPAVPEHDNEWAYGVDTDVKLDVFRYKGFSLDFDTKFHLAGPALVKYAGLVYEYGLSYMSEKGFGVKLSKYHLSMHNIDKSTDAMYNESPVRFPLEDSIRVKIIWRSE